MIKLTPVEERFTEFFDNWIVLLVDYLQQLQKVSNLSTEEAELLVSKLTAHYKEFYTVKWAAAHENVLAFSTPVWLTKLENAYSWFTGWKPAMLFWVVGSMRKILKEEQIKKIEERRLKIKLEEEKVEMEMERQQVEMADRKMVELVRMARRMRNAELAGQVDGLAEVALKGILGGLEKAIQAADSVRVKTFKGVLDVLETSQSVEFWLGFLCFRIQMRQWDWCTNNNLLFLRKKMLPAKA